MNGLSSHFPFIHLEVGAMAMNACTISANPRVLPNPSSSTRACRVKTAAAASLSGSEFRLASRIYFWSRRRHKQAFRVSEGSGEVLDASDSGKEDLEAKLAAAEAEAQVLRRELAARTGAKEVDLSKLKPAVPAKRIDGTGYRETLLSAVGEGPRPNEWGLTEAELQESSEDDSSKAELQESSEENEGEIVTRRLLIGVGLATVAIGLSFLKLPANFMKPLKPLPFYLVRILRLKQQLIELEASNADTKTVLGQLENISRSADDLKDTFLSAAAWLGDNAERASSLAYSIYGYLQQANYNAYFDNIGEPSVSQQFEFVRFSLQSTKAARDLIEEFLSLVPKDDLEVPLSNQEL